MPFAQLLLAMVQPIIARIMVTLGLSIASFVGMDLLMNQVISHAQNAWGGLPSGILQLAGLAGIGQALGIIMGAVLTRVLIWQLSRSTRIMGSNT
ncbi:MAG: DUF2523 domain-containing protein [Acidovorax sp.]|uniref:DUF2523 domain-containing protein n=1 Tax=Acidovorax sp. TaxID=1872122 RepID=UPI002634ADCD|nr:DUF2523 domain-containing protein [Acidovorax sp.]MDH4419200.1 DUF2523 domain-containing protein [Acidovorax sp.]